MKLQQTISKLTGLTVSEEDAMCYARDNFGVLATYLRQEDKSRIKELEEQLNKTAFDLQCQATENHQYREALESMNRDLSFRDNFTSMVISKALNRAEIKLTTGEEIQRINNPKIQ